MFAIISVIAFLLLAGAYGSVIPTKRDGPISPNLKLVATVDGKSFFSEMSRMNWTAAGEHCAGLGMRLAEITSKAQYDALTAAYSETDFHNGHWIGGRDAQLHRQFSWNSTGDAISNENFDLVNHIDTQYQTCLFYDSLANNRTSVRFYPCHKSEIFVLCST